MISFTFYCRDVVLVTFFLFFSLGVSLLRTRGNVAHGKWNKAFLSNIKPNTKQKKTKNEKQKAIRVGTFARNENKKVLQSGAKSIANNNVHTNKTHESSGKEGNSTVLLDKQHPRKEAHTKTKSPEGVLIKPAENSTGGGPTPAMKPSTAPHSEKKVFPPRVTAAFSNTILSSPDAQKALLSPSPPTTTTATTTKSTATSAVNAEAMSGHYPSPMEVAVSGILPGVVSPDSLPGFIYQPPSPEETAFIPPIDPLNNLPGYLNIQQGPSPELIDTNIPAASFSSLRDTLATTSPVPVQNLPGLQNGPAVASSTSSSAASGLQSIPQISAATTLTQKPSTSNDITLGTTSSETPGTASFIGIQHFDYKPDISSIDAISLQPSLQTDRNKYKTLYEAGDRRFLSQPHGSAKTVATSKNHNSFNHNIPKHTNPLDNRAVPKHNGIGTLGLFPPAQTLSNLMSSGAPKKNPYLPQTKGQGSKKWFHPPNRLVHQPIGIWTDQLMPPLIPPTYTNPLIPAVSSSSIPFAKQIVPASGLLFSHSSDVPQVYDGNSLLPSDYQSQQRQVAVVGYHKQPQQQIRSNAHKTKNIAENKPGGKRKGCPAFCNSFCDPWCESIRCCKATNQQIQTIKSLEHALQTPGDLTFFFHFFFNQ